MKIKIQTAAEITFYPEIEDNMELSEEKRFGFILKRPSRFLLIDAVYSKDPRAKLDYIKLFVTKILNPITLTMGKTERPFTLDDLDLPVQEIETIATQLWLKCVEISKESTDTKK